ncbi:response regulator transcription factor [Leptotrichia buccalis]|jgi:two component transcriptional regulator, winged helix family|uniref:Two component transcriptional regulator, winged helix family n=1 Tax=Leptotrichia buccalis (strain ATCC 14201 / DSM 1135 / JCM 12969 / NCTC 10249 / C-1013-b) TaxID=523794 RepID=C7NDC9_LEPBD|nr:response regulator transcription factor [Leptotrichia buccalis]ACV38091.1 two component transcriptional regulator, winged helix family [Leptotrichia buccalis C-1013-b]
MYKVLIADDNKQIVSILSEYCKKNNFIVSTVFNGEDALKEVEENKFDIVLLDVMMPKKDGFDVCREVRKFSNVPIIMITARGEDYEKIMGLEIGADDYIVKPFSPGEIIARINAILRRITPKNDDSEKIFSFDNLEIDLNNFTVKINNEIISLTKKEIEILWTLATNQNKVFTRENLLDLIWGFDYFGESRTVDTHIKRLRAKMDNYEHKKWNIKTIWGVGYKFDILEN